MMYAVSPLATPLLMMSAFRSGRYSVGQRLGEQQGDHDRDRELVGTQVLAQQLGHAGASRRRHLAQSRARARHERRAGRQERRQVAVADVREHLRHARLALGLHRAENRLAASVT